MIPTRDRPAEIERALSAALIQRGVPLEIIVVDDGSVAPVEPGHDARVRVLRVDPPGGVARARNAGIAAAAGEWIAFLDDDDLWAPDRLRRLLDAAVTQQADAAAGATIAIDGRGNPLHLDPPPDVVHLAAELRRRNALGGPSSVMVSRRLLERAGGFDPSFSVLADWELYLRLADRGRFAFDPGVLNGYVVHAGGMHVQHTGVALAEYARLAQRYGSAKALDQRGMYDEYFLRWAAGAHRRAGRRVAASRVYLRAFRRHRAGRDLVRAGVTLISEDVMLKLARRSREPLPEAPDWLALYGAPGRLRPAAPVAMGA